MRYCFILAGSEDRAYLLKRSIDCMRENRLYSDADIYLYWQGSKDKIPYVSRYTGIICADTLQGVFLPRYELFKKFGIMYDYTILIDDDLFMYPDTTYANSIAFLKANDDNGVCILGRQCHKRRNEFRMINYATENYNVEGGMVFPRKCVELIVSYLADRSADVTEDIFWILLYCKGFDLYRDFSSNVIHTCHRPAEDGSVSGYYKWRLEKPHVPLLPEYTVSKLVKDEFGDRMRYKVPECRDVNRAGMQERIKCREEMFKNGKT